MYFNGEYEIPEGAGIGVDCKKHVCVIDKKGKFPEYARNAMPLRN